MRPPTEGKPLEDLTKIQVLQMRKLYFIITLLVGLPAVAGADTIVFKDGTTIDVLKAWEENGEIKCKMDGVTIGYQKHQVKRVIRQRRSNFPRKLKSSEIADLKRMQPGSCFDLGRRYGYCTTLTLYGETCETRDDIFLPSWCRNRNETDSGLLEGINLAYKTLDLPAVSDTQAFYQNSSSCFELGRRFGRCAALSMHGETCDPKDDINIPLDCRGQPDTKNGISVGVRTAYQSLGLPLE